MLSVAAAFIYKERDARISTRIIQFAQDDNNNSSDIHCW